MNTALIFAGGTGRRMGHQAIPKQFLEVKGKPIIIYTLEHFEAHPEIDNIAIVCIESWQERLEKMVQAYGLSKVRWIVRGGATSQESTRNGMEAIAADQDPKQTIVLIHDGVRPLINAQVIHDNIDSVKRSGSAVTVVPATETVVTKDKGGALSAIIDRGHCCLARAPQSFYLSDIMELHELAAAENYNEMIDSATLMNHYGRRLSLVPGPDENIKITTPIDYLMFKSYIEARDVQAIF